MRNNQTCRKQEAMTLEIRIGGHDKSNYVAKEKLCLNFVLIKRSSLQTQLVLWSCENTHPQVALT